MATRAGHEVFNHTYSHPHLTQLSDAQIRSELLRAEQIIRGLTGKTTRPFFRPPYGERNSRVLGVAGKEGYQAVMWTVDALDWKESQGVTATQVKQRVLSSLKPGAIYLFHVGDNLSGQVLDQLISDLRQAQEGIQS